MRNPRSKTPRALECPQRFSLSRPEHKAAPAPFRKPAFLKEKTWLSQPRLLFYPLSRTGRQWAAWLLSKLKSHAQLCAPALIRRKVHGGRLFQPFTCGPGRIRQAVPRLDAHKTHRALHTPHQDIGKACNVHRNTAARACFHKAERISRKALHADAVMVEQMVCQGEYL